MDTAPTEEDFNKFFDELSALGDKPPPAAFGGETPPEDTGTSPAEPAVSEPPAVEPALAVEAEVPVAEQAPPPAPAQTEQLLERFVKAVENRPAPQPMRAAPPPPPPPPPLYAPEEVEALQSFEKDWPDVAKAMSILMRGNLAQNNAAVFQRLGETLGPQLEGVQRVQVNQQLMSLRQAIPDYDQVRDPVIQWVNTDNSIPSYLRSAYRSVIEQGDVSDISDLVGRWRQATGTPTQQAAEVPAKANELSTAAKQAAESLAPVVSKRTVTAPSTPTTFDDAFEAAAAALAKA